jgi:hypothetical protein
MSEHVTIAKSRLAILSVAIVVLLVLLILQNLKTQPPVPENLRNFLDNVNAETTAIVTVIEKNGKIGVFKKNLARLEPCGRIGDDLSIPAACGLNDVTITHQSQMTVTVVSASPEAPVVNANGTVYSCQDPQGHPCW